MTVSLLNRKKNYKDTTLPYMDLWQLKIMMRINITIMINYLLIIEL